MLQQSWRTSVKSYLMQQCSTVVLFMIAVEDMAKSARSEFDILWHAAGRLQPDPVWYFVACCWETPTGSSLIFCGMLLWDSNRIQFDVLWHADGRLQPDPVWCFVSFCWETPIGSSLMFCVILLVDSNWIQFDILWHAAGRLQSDPVWCLVACWWETPTGSSLMFCVILLGDSNRIQFDVLWHAAGRLQLDPSTSVYLSRDSRPLACIYSDETSLRFFHICWLWANCPTIISQLLHL